jgi:hypothetical protein
LLVSSCGFICPHPNCDCCIPCYQGPSGGCVCGDYCVFGACPWESLD